MKKAPTQAVSRSASGKKQAPQKRFLDGKIGNNQRPSKNVAITKVTGSQKHIINITRAPKAVTPEIVRKSSKKVKNSTFEFSLGLGRKPWKHQTETFEWMKDRHQSAGFLEMGLGKTGIKINVDKRHFALHGLEFSLIVGPLSVMSSWHEEIERCFPGEKVLNVTLISGKEARAKALRQAEPGTWILINYDAVVSLEEVLWEILAGKKYSLTADESTAIKNWFTQRCKALCRLGHEAQYRCILTGTPCPQGPQDVFGQYLFLDQTVFGTSFVNFRNRYFRMGGYLNKQIICLHPGVEKEFNELLYSIAKRYTNKDCRDLPTTVELPVRKFKLSKEEQTVYDKLAKEWVAEMKAGVLTANNGLVKSLRLAQVCTGFVGGVMSEEDRIEVDFKAKSKMTLLEEVLEELDGKVIIWCAWKKNVRDIGKLLDRMGIQWVDYYSDTEDKLNNELAFRNKPQVKVMVGTAPSGGAGKNFQSPTCRTVIYFSQNYSVFLRQQSKERARGGIDYSVNIIDLVAEGTVEGEIVSRLRKGEKLQDFILQNPERFVSGGDSAPQARRRKSTAAETAF